MTIWGWVPFGTWANATVYLMAVILTALTFWAFRSGRSKLGNWLGVMLIVVPSTIGSLIGADAFAGH